MLIITSDHQICPHCYLKQLKRHSNYAYFELRFIITLVIARFTITFPDILIRIFFHIEKNKIQYERTWYCKNTFSVNFDLKTNTNVSFVVEHVVIRPSIEWFITYFDEHNKNTNNYSGHLARVIKSAFSLFICKQKKI